MNPYENLLKTKGYFTVENFLSVKECRDLIRKANNFIKERSDAKHKSIFSTTKHQQAKDRYFMESNDKIRLFYEESDVNIVNKIGHGLHLRDEYIAKMTTDPRLNAILDICHYFLKPKIVQTMFILKQPHVGGEVLPHVDATFLQTRPSRILACWFALEDATCENGCLYGMPTDQYKGAASRLFNYNGQQCQFSGENPAWDIEKFIPIEVRAGTMVVFHGLFPHFSYQNISTLSRHAFTMHFRDESCEYLDSNWLKI